MKRIVRVELLRKSLQLTLIGMVRMYGRVWGGVKVGGVWGGCGVGYGEGYGKECRVGYAWGGSRKGDNLMY